MTLKEFENCYIRPLFRFYYTYVPFQDLYPCFYCTYVIFTTDVSSIQMTELLRWVLRSLDETLMEPLIQIIRYVFYIIKIRVLSKSGVGFVASMAPEFELCHIFANDRFPYSRGIWYHFKYILNK